MSTKNIDLLPIYRSFSYCMWLENAYNGEKNKICKKQKGLHLLCFWFGTKHYNIKFSLHTLSHRQMHTHSESRNVNKHLLPTQSSEEKQQEKKLKYHLGPWFKMNKTKTNKETKILEG